MEAQEMLNLAIEEIDELEVGEIFLVKELFLGYRWNRTKKAERLTLGTLFKNYATQNPEKIKILDKTSSHQQKYKIIKK